jgi:hypothetical protein
MWRRITTSRYARSVAGLAALAGTVLLLAIVVSALLTVFIPTDPEQEIGAVKISDVEAALPAAEAVQRRVPGLDEISGMVSREDPGDVDELIVGRVELDLGPDEWITTAGPLADFDGDGAVEPVRAELAGLVGREATFLARIDRSGEEGDVYTINGRPYRDPAGAPPWVAGGFKGQLIDGVPMSTGGEG